VTHRSALGAFSIDVPSATAGPSATFWAAALGRTTRVGTQHPEFQVIEGGTFSKLDGLIQDVGTDRPRVHLDLHTDDVEAEVARLTALGAKEVARYDGWVVCEDPSGLPFCVVSVGSDASVLEGAPSFES
jgi:hypothetical protein